jgi:uncharacterized membrane protein YsdA (DUF1294 family)
MKAHYLPIYLFIPLLALSFYYGYTPLLVPAIFAVASFIAFVIYYKDKSAAVSGAWRTPESTLHMLSLMCGWPGAIVAQQTLRHKTQKRSFRVVFWVTVLINVSAYFLLHTQEGSRMLRTYTAKMDSYLTYSAGGYAITRYIHPLFLFNR